jgi:hypothetical protein
VEFGVSKVDNSRYYVHEDCKKLELNTFF